MQQNTSSAQFKGDVIDLKHDLVLLLRPREFTWNGKTQSVGYRDFGLIAEEAAAVDPRLVTYRDGKPWAIRETPILAQMLARVQSHDQRIAKLEEAAPQWSSLDDRVRAVEEANDILRNQLVTAGIIPTA